MSKVEYSFSSIQKESSGQSEKLFRTSCLFDRLSLLLGEGNGTPLQYSCLENPMDGGAW